MFKIRNHQKSNYRPHTNNNISNQTSIKIPKFNIIFYKACQKTNGKREPSSIKLKENACHSNPKAKISNQKTNEEKGKKNNQSP